MKVLISGAGIAGPTLGYWLEQAGFEPTIVERAPEFRTGGYMIDFWGIGYEVAERMGLRDELTRRGYMVREVHVVNARGRKVASFGAEVFNRTTGGRYVSLPRGDLAEAIHGLIRGKVEMWFDDSIDRLEQDEKGVHVRFASGRNRRFDLVVGADGLHSRVRELVFGPESRFERFLGFGVAAFEVHGYRPRDELVYVMFTQVGRQIARFPMRGDRTMFLFVFADEDGARASAKTLGEQKAVLHGEFGGKGWECEEILAQLDRCDELYFDRVSQIRMEPVAGEARWSRGRVGLVGDAAGCVSLLAGEGAGIGMASAYLLAGELAQAGGDHHPAFAEYERRFAEFVLRKQVGARRLAGQFAPRTALGLHVRNIVMNLFKIPWVADITVGHEMKDDFEFPGYDFGESAAVRAKT
ncbi:MAG TPA: FAD-binding domain [Candidatus Didemnitutus sp.]|nr:FAD-binding domain [Candidatus Didemnitutus sp.]